MYYIFNCDGNCVACSELEPDMEELRKNKQEVWYSHHIIELAELKMDDGRVRPKQDADFSLDEKIEKIELSYRDKLFKCRELIVNSISSSADTSQLQQKYIELSNEKDLEITNLIESEGT